jgi:hypothetical protein
MDVLTGLAGDLLGHRGYGSIKPRRIA